MDIPEKEKAAHHSRLSKSLHLKPTKPARFPQAPILWQALRQSRAAFDADPNPINRVIASAVGRAYSDAVRIEWRPA
jgi:hypothetical protein